LSACWAFPLATWNFYFQNCLSPFWAWANGRGIIVMVILSSLWGGPAHGCFLFPRRSHDWPITNIFGTYGALPQHRSLNMLASPKIEACFCLSISWVDKPTFTLTFHSQFQFVNLCY
jgi:hypothetical protein